ncbi:MAG TPA: FtsK/SpoIIIE domain-containing protein [Gemmataceae bacterium]|nr:FtsK/SpoIIIE domain-containing protein [Gemmataceae bacterium]
MSPSPVEHPFADQRLDQAGTFRPDWDVPSAGREASDALAAEIDAVRSAPAPSASRKVHVLVGPSGYGKTHLFGRVLHAQGERVQFVHVPMTSDPARVSPAEHVRYRLVEALFHSPGGTIAPLRRHLARLLAPSFAAYFDQLPDALKARCLADRQSLDADPLAVLTLLGPAQDLAPFQHLADSVRKRLPGLAAGAVRAAILGLSPAADDARTWLRGEAGTLPEGRLRDLQLGDDPPDTTAALKTIGTLLAEVETPLVVSLDQTERILEKDATAFRDLTAALMAWLQEVPNLVLVVGCMSDAWGQLAVSKGYAAFLDRARVYKLDQMTPDQAAELVVRRMRSWDDLPAGAADGWPFDLADLKGLVDATPASPRALLQLCEPLFDEWRTGDRTGSVRLSGGGLKVDSDAEFLRQWSETVAAVGRDLKSAAHYQLDELWEGVREAVEVARLGGHLPGGVTLEKYTTFGLRKSDPASSPAAQIDLVAGSERFPVLVTVGKPIENGQKFNSWSDGLEAATQPPVVGAVAVWSVATPFSGKKAKGWDSYRERVRAGSVRPFPLDENEAGFRLLQALRQFLSEARGGNVLVEGRPLSAEECRTRLAATGALANLSLFEMLFHNWPPVEAARAKSAAAAATAVQPVVSRAAAHTTPRPSAATATTTIEPGPAPPRQQITASPPPAPPGPPGGGEEWARRMLDRAVEKLRNKGQPVHPVGVEVGPAFARLKVEPRDDTDFGKVKRQADNLKLHLGLESKPVIENRAGYISIDVQRPDRQTVPLADVVLTRPAELRDQPAFPLGVDVSGKPHWLNLSDPNCCHLLIAGATGSGKSELLKAAIAGLAAELGPDRLQFILIDPKRVTFNLAGSSPYLRNPVVFEAAEAIPLLEECCREMDRRYVLLQQRGKTHAAELTGPDSVPWWVVVFDEFADLMADKGTRKELEARLKRLGAKARAAGIHLILGTQRPEASVVTPLLRNSLCQIALRVSSDRESKLILDQPDAAALLGKGDLLWRYGGGLVRLQSPLVGKAALDGYLKLH